MGLSPTPDFENAFYYFNSAKDLITQLIEDGEVPYDNPAISEQIKLINEHLSLIESHLPPGYKAISANNNLKVENEAANVQHVLLAALNNMDNSEDDEEWSTDEGAMDQEDA